MTLKKELQSDLVAAMRAGQTQRRDTLRMLLAAIKQIEIDNRTELDDEGVQVVLAKQAKQRHETIADAKKAGRDAMIAAEQAELAVIESYLPQMMSREEIRARASQLIAELGATDMKGVGPVMGRLMSELRGKADGRVVNEVVRELLG